MTYNWDTIVGLDMEFVNGLNIKKILDSAFGDKISLTLKNLLKTVVCKSRAIACVIVDDKGNIVGKGTNNPSDGMSCVEYARSLGHVFEDDGRCPRRTLGFKSGEGLEICRAKHAERESIKDAQSRGVNTRGMVMYMTCECPCHLCADAIGRAGIKTIYIKDHPDYDPRGREILHTYGVEIKTWKI